MEATKTANNSKAFHHFVKTENRPKVATRMTNRNQEKTVKRERRKASQTKTTKTARVRAERKTKPSQKTKPMVAKTEKVRVTAKVRVKARVMKVVMTGPTTEVMGMETVKAQTMEIVKVRVKVKEPRKATTHQT